HSGHDEFLDDPERALHELVAGDLHDLEMKLEIGPDGLEVLPIRPVHLNAEGFQFGEILRTRQLRRSTGGLAFDDAPELHELGKVLAGEGHGISDEAR